MSRTIALLTDFGTADAYVGVMKAVMLGISPDMTLIDLTHAIQPQNIRQAAFTLLNNYWFFPPETIFLVVVDPGVGSVRKPIAVRAGDYWFVAPDNGVLSYVLREQNDVQAVQLQKPEYRLWGISNTFHGRDIFAPAAAHLAAGVPLEQFGGSVSELVNLPAPSLKVEGKRVVGEVLYADYFGNVITSVGRLRWVNSGMLMFHPRFGDDMELSVRAENAVVTLRGKKLVGIRRTYAEVERGDAVALVGSNDHLELAINQYNFARELDVHIGDPVELQLG